MRTLDRQSDFVAGKNGTAGRARHFSNLLMVVLFAVAVFGAGCKKDPAAEAIETDANGYFCMKCRAKFYTSRKVFLESKCPKCQEYAIEDVVGYLCKKDNHITIRPRLGGPEGESICEICRAHLESAMYMPRESNYVSWGAVKVSP